jgi:hypothetical protein
MFHDARRPNGVFPPLRQNSDHVRNGRVWSRVPQSPQISEPAVEETIKTGRIQVERKVFVFTLKENRRGRFLRITEEAKGRHNTITIPVTGLADVKRILDELTKGNSEPH